MQAESPCHLQTLLAYRRNILRVSQTRRYLITFQKLPNMEIVLNIEVPCLMHVLPCDHFRLARAALPSG